MSAPVTFDGSVWVRARAASSKGTVSLVPAWFRADSGTNLIKQGWGECNRSIVWLGSSVVECSHGKRETLVRVPVRPRSFSAPVTFGGQCGSVLVLRAPTQKRLSRRFRYGSEQIRGRI